MWGIDNRTPYAASSSWIRDSNGAEVWVVAVKATYNFLPDGQVVLSEIQHPLYSGPVMHSAGKSLLYDNEVGASKPFTDVILNGSAWSPTDSASPEFSIGLRIDNNVKLARVYGERVWEGRGYSAPEPTERVELLYENMVCGPEYASGYANPVGVNLSTERLESLSRLPSIEMLGQSDTDIRGFGALASHWPDRVCYAGTYDNHWSLQRAPLLPEDFNPLYWQLLPETDKKKARQLKGGELVTLAGVTPKTFSESRLISFFLPKVSLLFRTRFFDGSIQEHRAKLHTVTIEPDRNQIMMVWHTTLSCHRKVNQLAEVLIKEKKWLTPVRVAQGKSFPEWEATLQ
ncbi:DUF2169 family type VI secretion system accessory protein [Erwinia sorbitola]|uniref:DUF2169 domain-containing protein n=1 Tax=Erwinia sorbitola TaxID=2681984 RepID=A0A6I6EPM6_9GAMM|nr:DUF2169 domain-containing protein [Erwinia sorbitola]MTD28509.1 DUF2169 domain-containing protein [Erwinia sorbitola]QGU86622.1 DUF2169 domain-containing protein [Erwinia sorbitola]